MQETGANVNIPSQHSAHFGHLSCWELLVFLSTEYPYTTISCYSAGIFLVSLSLSHPSPSHTIHHTHIRQTQTLDHPTRLLRIHSQPSIHPRRELIPVSVPHRSKIPIQVSRGIKRTHSLTHNTHTIRIHTHNISPLAPATLRNPRFLQTAFARRSLCCSVQPSTTNPPVFKTQSASHISSDPLLPPSSLLSIHLQKLQSPFLPNFTFCRHTPFPPNPKEKRKAEARVT
ncbi:hypothetical protein BDP55DRAFT_22906 [Colletotrichum godetiae]|uniref:Uncharacterized protein n=1 Tax=Colletotrichum godetiae TaxID=1209918 RepID=A0AAJ0F5J0_9PEZI|nr:uncharacterized protein BDP55DRAFT_22906 [Colletotrichum godetiae]KAK1701508.1 hypothetical protein BDP55DRAFT_22906 [Colletotrichum godetiae]